MCGKMIDLSHIRFDERVEQMVVSVLRSGRIAQGPVVEALEDAVARRTGVRHAVAVSNGTAALVAALHVLGVGAGDEVITSPFTFVATLNAILAVGATARFADIDPNDFTTRPDCVEALVTDRTKVVMPVHLYGHPADMTSICAIARRHHLAIVEDAAQAMGATHRGRAVGGFGLGAFSMYATKNVTTGEGGVVTTDDDVLANSLRHFRNQGMGERYSHEAFGLNFRLTDLQAAVGMPQLEQLDRINASRARNAAALSAGLADIRGLVVPSVRAGDRHVFHQYTVRVESDHPVSRDALRAHLAEAAINSAVYYPKLVFDHPYLHGHPSIRQDECPVASRVAREVLSLPVHPQLSGRDLSRIIDAVRLVTT